MVLQDFYLPILSHLKESRSLPEGVVAFLAFVLSLAQLASFIVFIVIIVYLSTTENCSTQAPHLFTGLWFSVIYIFVIMAITLVITCISFLRPHWLLPLLLMFLTRQKRAEGLTDEQLAKLETFIYNPNDPKEVELRRTRNDVNTCSVCLTDFAEGDEVRQLKCSHRFHKLCADRWLQLNSSCPNCRKIVEVDSGAV